MGEQARFHVTREGPSVRASIHRPTPAGLLGLEIDGGAVLRFARDDLSSLVEVAWPEASPLSGTASRIVGAALGDGARRAARIATAASDTDDIEVKLDRRRTAVWRVLGICALAGDHDRLSPADGWAAELLDHVADFDARWQSPDASPGTEALLVALQQGDLRPAHGRSPQANLGIRRQRWLLGRDHGLHLGPAGPDGGAAAIVPADPAAQLRRLDRRRATTLVRSWGVHACETQRWRRWLEAARWWEVCSAGWAWLTNAGDPEAAACAALASAHAGAARLLVDGHTVSSGDPYAVSPTDLAEVGPLFAIELDAAAAAREPPTAGPEQASFELTFRRFGPTWSANPGEPGPAGSARLYLHCGLEVVVDRTGGELVSLLVDADEETDERDDGSQARAAAAALGATPATFDASRIRPDEDEVRVRVDRAAVSRLCRLAVGYDELSRLTAGVGPSDALQVGACQLELAALVAELPAGSLPAGTALELLRCALSYLGHPDERLAGLRRRRELAGLIRGALEPLTRFRVQLDPTALDGVRRWARYGRSASVTTEDGPTAAAALYAFDEPEDLKAAPQALEATESYGHRVSLPGQVRWRGLVGRAEPPSDLTGARITCAMDGVDLTVEIERPKPTGRWAFQSYRDGHLSAEGVLKADGATLTGRSPLLHPWPDELHVVELQADLPQLFDGSKSPVAPAHVVTVGDTGLAASSASGEVLFGETGRKIAGGVRLLSSLPGGRLAAIRGDRGVVQWDPNVESRTIPLGTAPTTVTTLVALPDGRLATGDEEGTILLWNAAEPGLNWIGSSEGSVFALLVLPEERLGSAHADGSLDVWDPHPGRRIAAYALPGQVREHLVLLTDGRLAGSHADRVLVWDPEDPSDPRELRASTGPVTALAALPDGRLASGHLDGSVVVWEPPGLGEVRWGGPFGESAGEPARLGQGESAVRAMAVLPQGQLASGHEDGAVIAWHPDRSGQPVPAGCYPAGVVALVPLPDRRLASVHEDGAVVVWDPAGVRTLTVLEPVDQLVAERGHLVARRRGREPMVIDPSAPGRPEELDRLQWALNLGSALLTAERLAAIRGDAADTRRLAMDWVRCADAYLAAGERTQAALTFDRAAALVVEDTAGPGRDLRRRASLIDPGRHRRAISGAQLPDIRIEGWQEDDGAPLWWRVAALTAG